MKFCPTHGQTNCNCLPPQPGQRGCTSALRDGLCWLKANEVKEKGWYWMRNNGETGIVYIREYGGKMCVMNWGIAEDGKYYGPLPEPI